VTGQVLHHSAEANVAALIKEGYKQPVFTRDQSGMALALLVHFPGERASIMWSELPWLVGLLTLMGLLMFGVRQYVRSAREQRKLARMQMDLVSNITHEFNTPISNIALALETLKKSPTSGSRISNDQLWDIIHVENKRLHANIRRVLDVSMLEGKQMILEPELHDVHALLSDALEGFGPAITREGAKVSTHFGAMEHWVRVDATYIGNMFQALIDNALKYGGKGVHIELRTEDGPEGVLIEISDDGPGIAPDEREMVFEKFYRIRRPDRYAVKGTGIGLYYARQVIEAHGGSIKVTGDRKKGSCFRIHLPVEATWHAALARS
jgi:two-component system phosphate regulon sensor histidine kinase PhoR